MKQLDILSKRYLQACYKQGYARIPSMTVNDVRRLFASQQSIDYKPDQVMHIAYNNNQIPIQLYHPDTKNIQSVILYLHGGGYVLRQSAQSANACKRLSSSTSSSVILVEYGLAPEKKFPFAIKEISFLINWIEKNKSLLSCSKDIPIFIYGESSGANLAVAALLKNKIDILHGMILMCPSLDYHSDYQSKKEFSTGFLLDADVRLWFSSQYLNSIDEKMHPLVSLTLSNDLFRLPRTLIISAYFDPLRDEAHEFHKKLIENGVMSEYKQLDTIHGFFNYRIQPYSTIADSVIRNFINHIE